MTWGLALALGAIVFGACAFTYRSYAQMNNLPIGTFFYSEKPIFVGAACLVGAVARLFFGVSHDHFGWWVFVLAVFAFLGGPVILFSELKERSQAMSLVAGPICVIGSIFVR